MISFLLSFIRLGIAANCEGGGYQFPKGLQNPDDTGD